MKKKILVLTSLFIIIFVVVGIAFYSYPNPSHSIINETSVKVAGKKTSPTNYFKEYEVSYNGKIHMVKINVDKIEQKEEKKIDYIYNFKLLFDNREIKKISYKNAGMDINNIDPLYDLNEDNFTFIKGLDNVYYLAIRFEYMLIIVNDYGYILTHQPFETELDHFTYIANSTKDTNGSYLNLENYYNFEDEKYEDIVEKYYYKSDKFVNNGNKVIEKLQGYVSTKIENNRIYSFVIGPDISNSMFADTSAYLYENEYVIYNNELYYKMLKKDKINLIL